MAGCNSSPEKTADMQQSKVEETAEADSVVVKVVSNPIDSEIAFVDEYDNYNHYRQGDVKLAVPAVLQDIHWRHQTHFLIYQPYDSIRMVLDESDHFWMMQTHDPKKNKELNFEVFYRREINPIDKESFVTWSFLRYEEYLGNLPLREQKIDSTYRRKLNYLADYKNKHGLSAAFQNNWQKFIKYEQSDALLAITQYEDLNENHLRQLSHTAKEYNDDASLANPYYRRGAWNCVRLLSFLSDKKDETNLNVFAEQIDNHFSGQTKEYLTLTLLRYAKENEKYFGVTPSKYDYLQTSFLSTAKYKEYKDYILRKESLEKLPTGQDQVVTADGKAADLNSVFATGKTHYVDFWASWCAPCMAEMPASQKLKEKYAGKPIKFLYFSRDDNPVAWERAVKRLGFSTSESYLMPAKRKSALATKLKISAIPRYVIMDDQGNILNRNAPRPSDPKIVEVLDGYVNR